MLKYNSRSLGSKWTKTKWLLNDAQVKPYVPDTKRFTKINLQSMLDSYDMLYFKPSKGTGGRNIVRIERTSSGAYRFKTKAQDVVFRSVDALCTKMKKFAGGEDYLLQQGIRLARTNGKPFDLRVMMQKTDQGEWKATAIFAKVGQPGRVATNYHQGGKLKYLAETLKGAGYSEDQIEETERRLSDLGRDVAKVFDRKSEGYRELGLDVAVDQEGRYWILEVNTRPQFYPLKWMRNKSMYRRIIRYAKQYGRTK